MFMLGLNRYCFYHSIAMSKNKVWGIFSVKNDACLINNV